MNRNDNFDLSFFENGKMFRSSDGEYVYKISDIVTIDVDIFDKDLNSITSRKWSVSGFARQIQNGTIEEYLEDYDG